MKNNLVSHKKLYPALKYWKLSDPQMKKVDKILLEKRAKHGVLKQVVHIYQDLTIASFSTCLKKVTLKAGRETGIVRSW